jgi:hypothetical protein
MSGRETMISRDRLHHALSHEVPDRVPLDPVQQLAKPCEQLLERFHIDTRYIGAHAPESFTGTIEKNERNGKVWHDLKDEFGVVWAIS